MQYIIGHQKPDLDSAVSPLALEKLFQEAQCFGYQKAQAVLAGPANHETKTIFKQFQTPLPPVLADKEVKTDDQFILVDHNEKSQRLPAIKEEQIVDICDHHKFSLNLAQPIYITAKPWGASATIVNWWMNIVDFKPSQKLAGLMVSAILSDTVGLKSATTVKQDREAVKQLNKVAKIKDLDQLTLTIFKAKSNIQGLSINQLLKKDYKTYDFGSKKVFINQIETVEQDKLTGDPQPLVGQLTKLKQKKGVDHAFCLVTDVLKINSRCLVNADDRALLLKAFPQAEKIKTGVYDLGPILSRKKEVAPKIEQAVS